MREGSLGEALGGWMEDSQKVWGQAFPAFWGNTGPTDLEEDAEEERL